MPSLRRIELSKIHRLLVTTGWFLKSIVINNNNMIYFVIWSVSTCSSYPCISIGHVIIIEILSTIETTNLTHFQLYIQITHYADISHCTGGHMSRSFIVLLVTCYQVTTAGKRFSFALVMVKIVQMNCTKS